MLVSKELPHPTYLNSVLFVTEVMETLAIVFTSVLSTQTPNQRSLDLNFLKFAQSVQDLITVRMPVNFTFIDDVIAALGILTFFVQV